MYIYIYVCVCLYVYILYIYEDEKVHVRDLVHIRYLIHERMLRLLAFSFFQAYICNKGEKERKETRGPVSSKTYWFAYHLHECGEEKKS